MWVWWFVFQKDFIAFLTIFGNPNPVINFPPLSLRRSHFDQLRDPSVFRLVSFVPTLLLDQAGQIYSSVSDKLLPDIFAEPSMICGFVGNILSSLNDPSSIFDLAAKGPSTNFSAVLSAPLFPLVVPGSHECYSVWVKCSLNYLSF